MLNHENTLVQFLHCLSLSSCQLEWTLPPAAQLLMWQSQWGDLAWSPFWLLKPASEHVHACLLPRLSWSWTVLLHSDTNRKLITSITAVSLSFVTYLLTLPHNMLVFLWTVIEGELFSAQWHPLRPVWNGFTKYTDCYNIIKQLVSKI
jgi:hypothetical protein